MKTEDLIRVLAADTALTTPTPERACLRALLAAVPLAAVVFFALLGPRADLGASLENARFLFKFVPTFALFATTAHATLSLARPTGRVNLWSLALAPAIVGVVATVEWLVLPPGARLAALIGHNALVCLTAIPAIGLLPLVVFIAALRNCAPVKPALSGGIAGLTAGGLAATFYAAHCTDDSPLFVGLWYSLAVVVLAVVGSVAGRRFARW
jgi:hypothetical protein